MRCLQIAIIVTASGLCTVLVGCSSAVYIRRINDGAYRVSDVKALSRFWRDDESATQTLCFALKSKNAAVRYFAAQSLEPHLAAGQAKERLYACRALVAILHDTATGTYDIWYRFGPGSAITGSVRSRALLTLTGALGKDFGLDREAWEAYLTGWEKSPPQY